jgi:hypothetical protein
LRYGKARREPSRSSFGGALTTRTSALQPIATKQKEKRREKSIIWNNCWYRVHPVCGCVRGNWHVDGIRASIALEADGRMLPGARNAHGKTGR